MSDTGLLDSLDCAECGAVTERLERLAPVAERYGQARAAANLHNIQVAHGVGAVETFPSRYHIFMVWFLCLITAIAFTIARTTSIRLLLESAGAIGGAWVALTFFGTAYDIHQGLSSLLVVAVCALSLPIAVIGLLTRPSGPMLRLLIAACLLVPAATIIGAMSIAAGRDLLERTDVIESMDQFSTQWSRLDDSFYYGVLGLTTLVAVAALALYRPLGQRMAAIPQRR